MQRKISTANLGVRFGFLTMLLAAAQGCSAISTGASVGLEEKVVTPAPSPMALSVKPAPSKTLARNTGHASWYGPGFSGKKTASGDLFDDGKLTAAHKTLPLGSKAKVTNLSNGRAVHVEINDRGPFVDNRIIDLSKAAAHALGMLEDGVIQVSVEPLTQ